jgi:hypothetical protein
VKLQRTLRRGLCAGLLGSVMLVAAAPAANAALSWNPPTADFGNQNVGSTSDPRTFTLIATCDAPGVGNACSNPPGGGHVFGTPTATGAGFAIVPDTNSCVAQVLVTPVFGVPASCVTQITFTPTSAGTKTGSLDTPSGPDVALSGSGVATGKGGQGTTTPGQTQTGKKCKKKGKKRSASSAKKRCKKKGKR